MNREESLGPSAVFELGEPNDAYAKLFETSNNRRSWCCQCHI